MPEESEDEIGTSAEASNAALDSCAEIADASGQRMAQVLLDMAMAPLLGIQIRGIGWEPVHLDLGMGRQILFDHLRAMGVEPVPDDDERARNVALEVTEGDHHVIAADGMREVSLVDVARQGQPDHRRECTALADASQDRSLPPRSPRAPRLGPEGEAGLIDEHDLRLAAASLFLIRGQSCVSQARTKASSRSRA
jgi:hypothetical protein